MQRYHRAPDRGQGRRRGGGSLSHPVGDLVAHARRDGMGPARRGGRLAAGRRDRAARRRPAGPGAGAGARRRRPARPALPQSPAHPRPPRAHERRRDLGHRRDPAPWRRTTPARSTGCSVPSSPPRTTCAPRPRTHARTMKRDPSPVEPRCDGSAAAAPPGLVAVAPVVGALGTQAAGQGQRVTRLLVAPEELQRAAEAEQRVVVRRRAVGDRAELRRRLRVPLGAEKRAPQRLADGGLRRAPGRARG